MQISSSTHPPNTHLNDDLFVFYTVQTRTNPSQVLQDRDCLQSQTTIAKVLCRLPRHAKVLRNKNIDTSQNVIWFACDVSRFFCFCFFNGLEFGIFQRQPLFTVMRFERPQQALPILSPRSLKKFDVNHMNKIRRESYQSSPAHHIVDEEDLQEKLWKPAVSLRLTVDSALKTGLKI